MSDKFVLDDDIQPTRAIDAALREAAPSASGLMWPELIEWAADDLEECAVLLAEVAVRFDNPHILDEACKVEGEFTFSQAGQMYNESAKKLRAALRQAQGGSK